jgi:hypothetical protein
MANYNTVHVKRIKLKLQIFARNSSMLGTPKTKPTNKYFILYKIKGNIKMAAAINPPIKPITAFKDAIYH